jgi:hypothetical protein
MNKLSQLISWLVTFLIATGGIYTITFLFNAGDSVIFKNIINVLVILFIFIFLIYKIKIKIKIKINLVVILILLLLILNIINYIHNRDIKTVHFNVISSIFVLAIYIFLININKSEFINLIKLTSKFSKLIIILISLLYLYSLIFNNEIIYNQFSSGFGGNRTNFSMWIGFISIIITLNFILHENDHRIISIYILFFSGMICVASGGRIGYLMILLLICIWLSTIKCEQFKKILILITFIFLSIIQSELMINRFNSGSNQTIIRDGSVGKITNLNLNEMKIDIPYIDNVTGGRFNQYVETLDILANNKTDKSKFIFGWGLSNIKLSIFGKEFEPHNLYIKTFFEHGIVGLSLIILITLILPIKKLYSRKRLLALYLTGLIPSLFQPNTFMLGINSILSFWIIYAYADQLE